MFDIDSGSNDNVIDIDIDNVIDNVNVNSMSDSLVRGSSK